MKRKTRNIVAAIVLAGVLVGGGAASAWATTTPTAFSGVANRYQQSRYFVYQNKATSSPSYIDFTYIGGGYLMNVKAQNGSSGTEYTEQKGLGVTVNWYLIPNGTPAGTQTRLIVTNNTWTTANVSIAGSFITE